jgi:hypothetical protein
MPDIGQARQHWAFVGTKLGQDRKREKKYHLVAHGYKAAKDTMVVYSISEHILTLRGIQCDKLTTAGKLMVDFSFQPEWSDTFEAAILQSEF